jgi:hypothetical protein
VLTKAEMPVPPSGHELGVVNSTVYARGRKVADVAIEEAGEWSKRPGARAFYPCLGSTDCLIRDTSRPYFSKHRPEQNCFRANVRRQHRWFGCYGT